MYIRLVVFAFTMAVIALFPMTISADFCEMGSKCDVKGLPNPTVENNIAARCPGSSDYTYAVSGIIRAGYIGDSGWMEGCYSDNEVLSGSQIDCSHGDATYRWKSTLECVFIGGEYYFQKTVKLETGWLDSAGTFNKEHESSSVSGCQTPASPILISLIPDQSTLNLTAAKNGVSFDLLSFGVPQQLAWTQSEAQAGFLSLDRNGDGVINDGTELFGNVTVQAPPTNLFEGRNGYRALRVFDLNSDGAIDAQDAIYSALSIWVDGNHNGISESDELISLGNAGIVSLSLNYRTVGRSDNNGNNFRTTSPVTFTNGRVGRSWDVLLAGVVTGSN